MERALQYMKRALQQMEKSPTTFEKVPWNNRKDLECDVAFPFVFCKSTSFANQEYAGTNQGDDT